LLLRGFFSNRFMVLKVVTILIGVVLIGQLFNLQILHGSEFRKESQNRILRQVTQTAPRGEILDRYGEILASNREGFNVEIYKVKMEEEERNQIFLKLVDIFKRNNVQYRDTMPEEEFEKYKKKYKLENYSEQDARIIAGIRYEIAQKGYSAYRPYEIATDVSKEVLAEIEERNSELSGVSISVKPIRDYPNKNLASHILGYIGKINKEEYDANKSKGYLLNDNIGKDGIESIMEEYLKGSNSLKKVEIDAMGKTTGNYEGYTYQAGDRVYLTLDSKLQAVAEESLKTNIQKISSGAYAESSPEANAGAVVAIDVQTGEILAMASYPDYDPSLFVKGISKEDWAKLNTSVKPMFNRNISGLYSPGSVFKMITSIAALETGTITTNTQIEDKGIYERYKDYQPRCWVYKSGRTHGVINVSDALKFSCNYFYYTVADNMGVAPIEKYSKLFGLGRKTGIELYGEKTGIIAGKEYAENIKKEKWYPGQTLQAAIGQSDHSFTPIQMARYIATLANGGQQIKPHIIKEVRTANGDIVDMNDVRININKKLGFEEEELQQLNIKPEHLQAVFEGMRAVTGDEGGTAHRVFSDFPIEVAGKTGTVQKTGGADNAWFVGFAPYDNPKIAICVVIEHGAHGNYTAPVVVDILTEYFGFNKTAGEISTEVVPTTNNLHFQQKTKVGEDTVEEVE